MNSPTDKPRDQLRDQPREHIVLYLNGKRHEIRGDQALRPITDYLRYVKRLTGTKVVCAEGDCGACTILIARANGDRPWQFEPVNACIIQPAQLDGAHILTIEALANGSEPHEVQRAMTDCHGSQCGFCTPGFVMAMMGHFERHPNEPATEKAVKNHLTGNLCRCTGYLPILDATVAVRPGVSPTLTERYHSKAIEEDLLASTATAVELTGEQGTLFAPRTVDELLALRAAHPTAKLIAGNTDLGVLFNKGKWWPAGDRAAAISLSNISSLRSITTTPHSIRVGALSTLAEIERACEGRVDELARLLRVFASPQIKGMATLVGNVANGSPIGDTIPALFALNAKLLLQRVGEQRWVPIREFYRGYKVFDLLADEVITAIEFDTVDPMVEHFRAYKVCQRKDLDISFVSAAYRLRLTGATVVSSELVYGGVGPTVVSLEDSQKLFTGAAINDRAAMERVAQSIESEVSPRSDVRGSELARRILAANMFRRLIHELNTQPQSLTAEVQA